MPHITSNLPHIYPPEATFFVTFRLKDSLLQSVIAQLKEEKARKEAEICQKHPPGKEREEVLRNENKRYFARFDAALERHMHTNDFLWRPEIAQTVADKMKERDGSDYDLIAYCIMPNHVHWLFSIAGYPQSNPPDIQQSVKGGSALLCNRLLGRTGSFWQKESYDHYVRNGKELVNITDYIVQNPVKAGLCREWEEWPFSYWNGWR